MTSRSKKKAKTNKLMKGSSNYKNLSQLMSVTHQYNEVRKKASGQLSTIQLRKSQSPASDLSGCPKVEEVKHFTPSMNETPRKKLQALNREKPMVKEKAIIGKLSKIHSLNKLMDVSSSLLGNLSMVDIGSEDAEGATTLALNNTKSNDLNSANTGRTP